VAEHHVQLASGERIHSAQVVIATGSTARREAIPGGKTYDLFSCDVEDAQHLCERFARMRQDTVTLIIGEPRPGTRTGIHRLDGSFSARAAAQSDHPPTHRRSASAYGTPGRAGCVHLEQIVSKLGVRLLTGQAEALRTEQEVRLNVGQRVASDLTALKRRTHKQQHT
jgi:hypothetical protein